MSEMVERVALAIRNASHGTPLEKDVKGTIWIAHASAAIEAMRDYRGEVEDALDRVPGGFGRAAWTAGIEAALAHKR